MSIKTKRRGLSPVIATIILTAAVITLGAVAWAYAKNAGSLMANDYIEEVIDEVENIVERYTIEKIYFNDATNNFTVWVYNYGSISITIDTYISVTNGQTYTRSGTLINARELKSISFNIDIPNDTIVNITCFSRRSNREIGRYYVP